MFAPEHLDFHFPLFTTCGHMLVQFSLASLVLLVLPQFRPRYDSISNPHNDQAADEDLDQHKTDSKKPLMTKMFYFTRIGPCGMATGLDIGLGNMSLKYISLTFYSTFPPPHSKALLTIIQQCVNLHPLHLSSSLHSHFASKSPLGVSSQS